MAGGRPKKYTDERIAELLESLNAYLDETEIPILKEWCYKNRVPSNHVYDFDEFSESIKVLIDKKEANLERYALAGDVDKTMAIFSLKQLGWSDRKEITGASGGPIVVNFDKAFQDV